VFTQQNNDLTKRRILWIVPLLLDVELYKESVLEILKNLAKRGHITRLIAMRSRDFRFKAPRVHISAIPLRHLPVVSNVFFVVAVFLFLPIYITAYKPNFIIVTPNVSIFSVIPHFFVLKFRKIRLVLDIRSTPVETRGLRGTLQKLCFLTSILVAKKIFDGITIITPSMKKEVCNNFDISPSKVGVWTSGVSTSLFDPQKFSAGSAELRSRLGLTGKFVILYHGVLTRTRGLQETISAMEMLKHKYYNIVFLLLGTGPILSELKVLALERGLQENIIVHDPVEYLEVPKFINMCDAGIVPLPNHPYWRFQSPLKLLEYLAMAKVVILTDIPAHRNVIGEAKCGIYLSSVKPIEIAKAIEYVYCNEENLKEWGRVGRKIVEGKYTWGKVAKDLENYLLSFKNEAEYFQKYK
jgi:glycosyltransferase involved in cell wall biosynthesis